MNKLQFFHVVGELPLDLMHDLLERVILRLTCEMFLHFIAQKLVTLDKVSYITQNFNYDHIEMGAKPSLIQLQHLVKKRLRQSASQSWLLFVNLPLKLSHLGKANDKNWDCFNNLQDLTRLVYKESLSNYDILKMVCGIFWRGKKRYLK